jgi:hypothetical protein
MNEFHLILSNIHISVRLTRLYGSGKVKKSGPTVGSRIDYQLYDMIKKINLDPQPIALSSPQVLVNAEPSDDFIRKYSMQIDGKMTADKKFLYELRMTRYAKVLCETSVITDNPWVLDGSCKPTDVVPSKIPTEEMLKTQYPFTSELNVQTNIFRHTDPLGNCERVFDNGVLVNLDLAQAVQKTQHPCHQRCLVRTTKGMNLKEPRKSQPKQESFHILFKRALKKALNAVVLGRDCVNNLLPGATLALEFHSVPAVRAAIQEEVEILTKEVEAEQKKSAKKDKDSQESGNIFSSPPPAAPVVLSSLVTYPQSSALNAVKKFLGVVKFQGMQLEAEYHNDLKGIEDAQWRIAQVSFYESDNIKICNFYDRVLKRVPADTSINERISREWKNISDNLTYVPQQQEDMTLHPFRKISPFYLKKAFFDMKLMIFQNKIKCVYIVGKDRRLASRRKQIYADLKNGSLQYAFQNNNNIMVWPYEEGREQTSMDKIPKALNLYASSFEYNPLAILEVKSLGRTYIPVLQRSVVIDGVKSPLTIFSLEVDDDGKIDLRHTRCSTAFESWEYSLKHHAAAAVHNRILRVILFNTDYNKSILLYTFKLGQSKDTYAGMLDVKAQINTLVDNSPSFDRDALPHIQRHENSFVDSSFCMNFDSIIFGLRKPQTKLTLYSLGVSAGKKSSPSSLTLDLNTYSFTESYSTYNVKGRIGVIVIKPEQLTYAVVSLQGNRLVLLTPFDSDKKFTHDATWRPPAGEINTFNSLCWITGMNYIAAFTLSETIGINQVHKINLSLTQFKLDL